MYKRSMDEDNGDMGRTECGRWEWAGQGRAAMGEKWGQM